MKPITVAELQAGDIIRFSESGRNYTLTGVTLHSNVSELRHLNFVGGIADCTMPETATVLGLELPRIIQVPCLLCKDEYRVRIDLTSDGTVRAVVCDGCDAAVTARVKAGTEDD